MGTLDCGAIDVPPWYEAVATKDEPTLFISDPGVSGRFANSPLTTLIVCGNCAGDAPVPRKTVLAADGTCQKCGGRSYVLASSLTIHKKQATRLSQQRQIEALAEQLGLIRLGRPGERRDMSRYRSFLKEHYGVDTTARMNETERASVITALTLIMRPYEEA